MMEPYSVRVLTGSDVVFLREMLIMFGEAFEEQETYVSLQPDDEYLERLLRSAEFVAVAAFLGNEVVGGLAGYVLPKFEQARRELYIYDLAVHAPYRRLGIATAMIAEVQRLAAENGVYLIFVQAELGDDPAVALYSKLGTKEEVLHFDIPPNGAA